MAELHVNRQSAPESSTKPTAEAQPDETKLPAVRKGERTWQQLEAIFAATRAARKVDESKQTAMHRLSQLYLEITNPAFTDSADYPTHCTELGKWRDELPESPTPLIALAAAHIDWAWQARGSGFAYTVSEEAWNLFHARIDEARKLLERAVKLGAQDGQAHRLQLLVGMAEGWPDDQMREVFDAGRKLDPAYFPLYEQMAVSLMPRWGGAPGDVERFAAEVAGLLPGDDGLAFFGLISHAIHCYECNDPTTILWGEYDRKLLAQSADVLAKRYSQSQGVVQFAALCSLVCQDHAVAQRIRPLVGKFDLNYKVFVWKYTHQEFLDWAAAETIPGGEESSFRAALAGCVDLSFADDSRYVWVGHQFGARSVTLMDAQTGKVELELPHPGGIVNRALFDNDRKLVLVAAWRGPLVGWMLFDLENLAEPITFSTKTNVDTIALNPKRRQVVWYERGMLRLLDLTTMERKTTDVKMPSASDLVFSPDGSRLAAGFGGRFFVLDSSTGTELFKLPGTFDSPWPKQICRKVLRFEEDGRILAIASSIYPTPQYALVRYSADGKQSETLLPDVGQGLTALSPDRRLLAIARATSPNSGPATNPNLGPCGIDIYDVAAGQRVKQLGGHWIPIGNLQFSADSKKLASIARMSDVIKIWSLEDLAINDLPAAPPAQQNGSATPMESGTR